MDLDGRRSGADEGLGSRLEGKGNGLGKEIVCVCALTCFDLTGKVTHEEQTSARMVYFSPICSFTARKRKLFKKEKQRPTRVFLV